MSAVSVALAEAIKLDLNETAFSLPLTAERGYVLPVHLDGSKDLQAWVMAAEVESEAENHDDDTETHTVHIALVQKLPAIDNATVDPLAALAQEVRDHFRKRSWETAELDAFVEQRANKPLYDPERLRTKRQFFSLITLTCRVVREVG